MCLLHTAVTYYVILLYRIHFGSLLSIQLYIILYSGCGQYEITQEDRTDIVRFCNLSRDIIELWVGAAMNEIRFP